MNDRLPSLRSIEAFVVVARLLSFSEAANNLNITQPAVTRRIQKLEDDLGYGLFQRIGNKLVLTASGENYLKHAGPAFDALHMGTRLLRKQRLGARVRIRLAPTLASSWLVSHLNDFHRRHRNIELELQTADSDGDFAVDDVDLMISFGHPEMWPGLRSEPLIDTQFFPVCSPSFAAANATMNTPDEISRMDLIGIKQLPGTWARWFEQTGSSGKDPKMAHVFDNVQLAYAAASCGLGVILGTDVLCFSYLERGQLIKLSAPHASLMATFHLVGRETEWDTRAIRDVRHWLRSSVPESSRHHELAGRPKLAKKDHGPMRETDLSRWI